MRRPDMIACGRHAERILAICEFFDFDDGIKDKIQTEANAIQALLEGETERQRAYDRERKAKAADPPTESTGTRRNPADSDQPERIPISPVVEEAVVEEGVVVEGARRIPIPPVEASPTPEMVAARVSETIREKSGGLPVSNAPALRAILALQAVGAGDLPVIEKILQAAEAAAYDELVVRQGSPLKYNVNLVFSPNSSFVNAAHAEVTGGLRSKAKHTKVIAAAKTCGDCRWPNMVCGRHNSAMGGV